MKSQNNIIKPKTRWFVCSVNLKNKCNCTCKKKHLYPSINSCCRNYGVRHKIYQPLIFQCIHFLAFLGRILLFWLNHLICNDFKKKSICTWRKCNENKMKYDVEFLIEIPMTKTILNIERMNKERVHDTCILTKKGKWIVYFRKYFLYQSILKP